MIKHALSGSNLYQQWNPGNRPKNIRGEEYIKFIKTVKDAITNLKQQGYRPIIRAMVWQQGEADARDIAGMEQSRQYSSNLKNFIEQIRKEFNSENMLFVYGTVMPTLLIPADDLQMLSNDYQTPAPKDDVHLGTFGILTLGERFADAIYQRLK